jgi:hypothetical protein
LRRFEHFSTALQPHTRRNGAGWEAEASEDVRSRPEKDWLGYETKMGGVKVSEGHDHEENVEEAPKVDGSGTDQDLRRTGKVEKERSSFLAGL